MVLTMWDGFQVGSPFPKGRWPFLTAPVSMAALPWHGGHGFVVISLGEQSLTPGVPTV